ncbi:MAG: hypothetical protein HGA22_05300 [Clostridiales bacterium]|nr:hypothetical protein [Clostridiales bacterium]
MAGIIKMIIDHIILQRSRGNQAIAEMTKAKFILKGLNPDKFDEQSPDDATVIDKLYSIAKQLNVELPENNKQYIKTVNSLKTSEIEAVAEIVGQLAGFDTRLLIYFASPAHDQVFLSKQMQEAFAGCTVFGCSTAGEMANGAFYSGSVVAMAISSGIIEDVRLELVENLADNPDMDQVFISFEKHFNESLYTMDSGKYAGIVLIDGMSKREEFVMDQIGNRTNIYFVGGSAGDDRNFNRTCVYANGMAYNGAAVLALIKISDNARLSVIKTQSFRALERVLTATRVNGESREVIEFNNRPAALEYMEAVGASSVEAAKDCFITNPVGIIVGSDDIFVRSPQQVKGNSILFYCNIPEGMDVNLLESVDIIEDTRASVACEVNKLGGAEKISGIIDFQCVLRTNELRKKNLLSQYGCIFGDIPNIGFSTYGEEYIGHMNQTSTMLMFSMVSSSLEEQLKREITHE